MVLELFSQSVYNASNVKIIDRHLDGILDSEMSAASRQLIVLQQHFLRKYTQCNSQHPQKIPFSHPLDKNIPFYSCLICFYSGLLSQLRL